MKLLVFSDIHSDVTALARLMEIEADYYFCAGDVVTFARGFERVGPVMAPRAERMYVIPGNHESTADIAQFCAQYGFHDFHGKSLRVGDHWVAGLGYSSPTPFDTPGEYAEAELEQRLAPFADLEPLVLICHAPPQNTDLDRIKEGLHGGSSAVRAFLDAHQPAHFFCGHIHEAQGKTVRLGATHARNVGKPGYLLEL